MVEGKRVHVQPNVAKQYPCMIDCHNSVLDTIWYGSILFFLKK